MVSLRLKRIDDGENRRPSPNTFDFAFKPIVMVVAHTRTECHETG